jgi:hypothetical protein
LAVHTVRIALEGQRPPFQMRYQNRTDAGVVVDDLALGEAGRGVQNFVQVRQFQLSAQDFNCGCIAHAASLGACASLPLKPRGVEAAIDV